MEKRFLIARWLGSATQSIPVYDEASVSSARQRVREAGDLIHAGKQLVESMALIASELTHNQLAHSKQGYFAVRPLERSDARGLEIVAADLGPGIEKPVLTGSTRTEGSLGAGLESVFRLADEVEVDTRRAEGLCVVARRFEAGTPEPFETAVAGEPYPGELISGDDAICLRSESGFLAAVCDGLGHGPEAREASNKAIESIVRNRHLDLREIVLAVNSEISGSRGCALSVCPQATSEPTSITFAMQNSLRLRLWWLGRLHCPRDACVLRRRPSLPAPCLRCSPMAWKPKPA
jgi:anti-sigma regulatory factor (Ser/Thr protein kinase)